MGGAVIELPVRVLSLWAPWAWAILCAGKDIENRSLTFPRSFTGEFWLHASLWPGTRKPLNARQRQELAEQFDISGSVTEQADALASIASVDEIDAMRGKIVGRVTLTGYVESSPSPWFVPGNVGLRLANPVALRTPVPAVGLQGWWFVKPAELALLRSST